MQVLSTSVLSGQTNVYRDAVIAVTFDAEVADACLTNENFILYKVVGGAIDSQHPIVLSKQTDRKILEISPTGDLLANTDYLLFIRGDTNINDVTFEGIYGVPGNVMAGNYVVTFQTGIEIEDSDELDPIDHDTPDGTGYDPVDNGTSGTVYNTVVRTNPYFGEANITTLATIIAEFSSALQSVNVQVAVNVERATWPFDTVPDLYQPSGFVMGNLSLSGDAKTLYIPIPSGYNSLPDNTLYQCIIEADSTTGLGSDYSWLFFSKFDPAYAHPRQVRSKTGTQFSDVPDSLIWFLIHENSRYVDFKLGIHYSTNADVPENVNRWVVCKTAQDLYEQVFGTAVSGVNGSIIQKTLGDLTIKYDSASSGTKYSSAVPKSISDCVANTWLILTGGLGEYCVKSGQTTHYPGRHRSHF